MKAATGSGLAAIPGHVGRAVIAMLADLGSLTITGFHASARLGRSFLPGERFRAAAVVDHVYRTGTTALPIVALISLMIGLILAFQSAYQLERLGAVQYVASLVSVAITRELGPVITAIVVAGRSGSSIAAEISSMKIQEEIDALKVMGFNPLAYLVAPRLLAMLIALPILTAFADLIGILGGLACATWALGIPPRQYAETALEALQMRDFLTGLLKAGVFGSVIAIVGAWCGLNAEGGPEGVGIATTRSVVLGILMVIVADLVFTGLFFNFG